MLKASNTAHSINIRQVRQRKSSSFLKLARNNPTSVLMGLGWGILSSDAASSRLRSRQAFANHIYPGIRMIKNAAQVAQISSVEMAT